MLLRSLVIGFVVASAVLFGALEGLERWGVNVQFALRGPIPPRTPIVIVSIDEDSFDELDLQWPWPRALHAKLLDILSRGKPAAVGLDFIFDLPSSRGPKDDQALGLALERARNVVLAAFISQVKNIHGEKTGLNPPIDELFDRAAAIGFVNYVQDEGGYIREGALTRIFQDKQVSGFDAHLHRLAVKSGIPSAPLPDRPRFLINYRGGPGTFPTIPYYQVVTGEVRPEAFTGKIVLVGATSAALHDAFPTPFATHGEMPGVEIHANVLETLFQGIPLKRAPHGMGVLLILSAGLLAVWLTNRFGPLTAFALIASVILGYAALAFLSFAWSRLLLDITAVPLTLILGYGATVVEEYIQEQRQRALLMRLFSRHVSKDVAESIWEQRDNFMEGGRPRPQMQTVTILFTDLQGFTTVSELLRPQDLLDWLNVYMEAMASLVSKHKGVVDDYAGDAIKANFGVPVARTTEAEIRQDAINAVNCALAMEQELRLLNRLYEEQELPTVGMRVGIATGQIVAGSLGSQDRLKYTTVGDTVNVASRLESFEKDLTVDPYFKRSPCRILIEETTLQYVGKEFRVQKIGEVVLRGRVQKIRIYRVLGREDGTEPYASLRDAPRIKVETTVGITAEGLTVQVPTYDLSTGGLAVYKLPVQVEKSQVVRMELALTADAPPFVVSAKVAWSVEGRAAFAFLDLQPDDRAAIEKFLAPLVPSRKRHSPQLAETQ